MNKEKEVAIASQLSTLEDMLKSRVCSNGTIYCQFTLQSMGVSAEQFIKRKIESNYVSEVVFSDGIVIKREEN